MGNSHSEARRGRRKSAPAMPSSESGGHRIPRITRTLEDIPSLDEKSIDSELSLKKDTTTTTTKGDTQKRRHSGLMMIVRGRLLKQRSHRESHDNFRHVSSERRYSATPRICRSPVSPRMKLQVPDSVCEDTRPTRRTERRKTVDLGAPVLQGSPSSRLGQKRVSVSPIKSFSSSSSLAQISPSSAGVRLVRQVWNQVLTTRGAIAVGQEIFRRMFFRDPNIRETFRLISLENNYNNFCLFQKTHAKAVASMLNDVIQENPSAPSELILERLEKIAKIHASFPPESFQVTSWDLFGESIIESSLEWGDKQKRNEASSKAWLGFVMFMMETLKESYILARKQGRMNSPRPSE